MRAALSSADTLGSALPGIRKGTESTWLLTILRTYQRQRDYEEDQ
jgi:hypothetical protein